ncbi:hypothetical protein [Bacillus litorisediminis]|nr:hypothetical protein [Bacillus litorisediminis]
MTDELLIDVFVNVGEIGNMDKAFIKLLEEEKKSVFKVFNRIAK